MKYQEGTVAEYLAAFLESERYGPRIVAHKTLPPVQADFAPSFPALAPELLQALESLGIGSLYSHQARAIDLVLDRKNIVVATPTASGKSLIYNLPVFDSLVRDPQARALYLFPLKALAQDQARNIESLAALLPGFSGKGARAAAAIYDGDTSSYRRRKIREELPGILVTNPDMLHMALLPYHDLWGGLFAGLTHVIIDEVHTYRGVFGSHMSWVMRRLNRICRLYGSEPVFILSSATVGNPGELGEKIIGLPVTPVTVSGTPRPPRNVVLLNPLDSAAHAATMLLESAVRRGLRTIVYTQSRKMTELITMWTARRKEDFREKIASYRAGFLPGDRRQIEQRLGDGSLLGVISTSALELGIDIGNLDICILVGYPGSMMATWQRAGRVGRSQQESLVVLIAHEDALDQYFMRHPEDFFSRKVEAVVLNPDNRNIARQHLTCAAAEAPLTLDDPLCGSPAVPGLLTELVRQGRLLRSADGATWFAARKYPQRDVDLRGGGTRYRIRHAETGEIIGEIDGHRALHECHPGAVYLHMAQSWLIESLDLEGCEVMALPRSPHYFTRPVSHKTTEIVDIADSVTAGTARVFFGTLRVTETITGFRRYLLGSQKVIGFTPLDLPPQEFETEGFWLVIPRELQQDIESRKMHFMGGIHAMEHAMIALMPLLVLCDRNDIGGISHPWHEQLEQAAVFIFDGHSGGVGLAEKAFAGIGRLLRQTHAAVRDCPCELGCPSCVHSPKCGSGNRPIDKEACIHLLAGLLQKGKAVEKTPPRTIRRRYGARTEERDEQPFRLPERYGVFDVETRRSAQDVGGWHRADRMGVSMAVLYDAGTRTFTSFREEEIERLVERLYSLELVIGFNHKRFDYRVLAPYTSRRFTDLPSLDILEEIYTRLGYRLSLERLAEHTLGVRKNGNGLLALRWFREGRFDLIDEYCRRDVEITRDLFLYGLRRNHLLFRNKGGMVVQLPVDFQRRIRDILTDGGRGLTARPASGGSTP
jgi:DEAD/DEAH box helicase domain-containing protein